MPVGCSPLLGRFVLYLVMPHLQVAHTRQLADRLDDVGVVDEPFKGRRRLPDVDDLPHGMVARPFSAAAQVAEADGLRLSLDEAIGSDVEHSGQAAGDVLDLGVVENGPAVEEPVTVEGGDLFVSQHSC